jgi:two-component system chemotaxis response regulator CheY
MAIPASVDRNLPILVVDDFSTMRRIIRNALRQLGFTNITEAENGREALEYIKASDFQFIISDWNMPTMQGIDLLRAVRHHPKYRDVPFLMITAESQKVSVLEAAAEGVSSYIVKPFSADILEKKLQDIFLNP